MQLSICPGFVADGHMTVTRACIGFTLLHLQEDTTKGCLCESGLSFILHPERGS